MTYVEIVTILFSLFALLTSLYTLWNTLLYSKIALNLSSQCKLYAGNIYKNEKSPILFISMAFSNIGGKIFFIENVRASITITESNNLKNKTLHVFEPVREYTDLVNAHKSEFEFSLQKDISPLVILGKSTEMRKYIFAPKIYPKIDWRSMPEKFDLTLKVEVKNNSKWIQYGTWESNNITDVWQDLKLNSEINNFRVIDLEKN